MFCELFRVAFIVDATFTIEPASAATVKRDNTFVVSLACENVLICREALSIKGTSSGSGVSGIPIPSYATAARLPFVFGFALAIAFAFSAGSFCIRFIQRMRRARILVMIPLFAVCGYCKLKRSPTQVLISPSQSCIMKTQQSMPLVCLDLVLYLGGKTSGQLHFGNVDFMKFSTSSATVRLNTASTFKLS